jgi:hypothetical protein
VHRLIPLSVIVFVLLSLFPPHSSATRISIESRIGHGPWRIKNAVEAQNAVEVKIGQSVFLRVRKIKGAVIRWFQIEPNIDTPYNNAVWPWLPNAYKWKGFDEIEYRRTPLTRFNGKWEIKLFPDDNGPASETNPTDKGGIISNIKKRIWGTPSVHKSFHHRRLGSFWFQAEVSTGNRKYSTPGIESKDNRGLSPKVFRVSIRRGNDLLGHLTSFFNVPAVFGSTPYQVRNYIGIDCADVLMAAYCRFKNIPIKKDYNVAMVTSTFKTVVQSQIKSGKPVSIIQWQKEIRPGDFIAVRYPGGRQYQHIGALYSDRNKNGILDGEDRIIHAGPNPLHFTEIKDGMFDGTIRILRTP